MAVEAEEVTKEIAIKGYPVCRGVAIGKPFFLSRGDLSIQEARIAASKIDGEIERYRQAVAKSQEDILRLQHQLKDELATEGVMILEAQIEMLNDPLLTTEIEKEIRKSKKNAEFVFHQATAKYQERFHSIDDPFLVERFHDFQDVARRIFGYLNANLPGLLNNVPPGSIVCIQELAASDAAGAHSASVSAFLTEVGGPTSHASIVARAKGIPCVANMNLAKIKECCPDLMIIDGRTGKVILNPGRETLKRYERLREKMRDQFQVLEKVTEWPAETFDGYAVRLFANVDKTEEVDLVHKRGGIGVGLFRTEYMCYPGGEAPSEEEQTATYLELISAMKGLPVVIRTFDFGVDKVGLSGFASGTKTPLLSGRSTRLLLKEKMLLREQLRAILKASVSHNVSLLFPMISTVGELQEAKQLLAQAREDVQLFHPLRVGCMIEVPSAALLADHIVKECDFLSIGTNDLVQYAFALDRGEGALHDFFEPTDPSIIRLIKLVTNEASKAKVPVSVCGEIASDPRFSALLLGLGVQEFSVAPRYLPVVKNAIRRTSIVDAVELAETALSMTTSQEVLELLVENYHKNVPEDLFYNFI